MIESGLWCQFPKRHFFPLTTLFNSRAICHDLCDFGLDMTRVIGNEEMAEKFRPGVLCNWMKTHQPRPLDSMPLLYRAQMMFITVWGLCGLQSSGTRNPQSLLCIHTVNIHTYTRGSPCHPPEPDLDKSGLPLPMGLRHWHPWHGHACSLRPSSPSTDFPSFFGLL